MKLLMIPGNNSLSHVAKCLALQRELSARGHQVLIAVSRRHASFLASLNMHFAVLPDIQEADMGGVPSWSWFNSIDRIQNCIRAETELIRQYRPDRVLGIFRFTAKAAAASVGIPYDSLLCGCMLPDNTEVLGFAPDESGADQQVKYLTDFFRLAGRKISKAAAPFASLPITDARSMLEGEFTFLWDFPEFMNLPHRSDRIHIGPLRWEYWPHFAQENECSLDASRPLALVSFGMCCASRPAAQKLVDCLLDQNYNVIVAAGGQQDLMKIDSKSGRVMTWLFAPIQELIGRASLVVSHGGQLTILEALSQGVPVAVMPFQPEQAHNGVCLERIGCGCRLIPSVVYKGKSKVYTDALFSRTNDQIAETIRSLMHHPQTSARLARAQSQVTALKGAAMLADMIEQA